MQNDLSIEKLKTLFQNNSEQIFADFFTFLRFPSISTDAAYQVQVKQCADWLKHYLQDIGFQVNYWELDGHPPVIFAEDLSAGPNCPTLLIYNHYDVQPVDPLELWETPPFEPAIRNGEIYARGAVDDKGQCFYVIQALKMLKKEKGKFPLNIKFLIEGEEESGSEALTQLLPVKSKELKADYALIVDTGIPRKDQPAITLGVRGLTAITVTLKGSKHDLHSGEHGGLAYNPNRALAELLAKLFDGSGKITIPGFYDDVIHVKPQELEAIDFKFDADHYRDLFEIEAVGGEQGFNFLERNWLRPTLEINGVCGGYTGKGFKTVIPAQAFAKISCRLVPNQDPQKMQELLHDYFTTHVPPGMHVEVTMHAGGGPALRTSPNSTLAQEAARVFSEVFGKPCQRILNGASIPIVADLAKTTAAEMLLVGVGLPGDQIHAPNEHFGKDRLELGYLVMARLIQALAIPKSNKTL